MPEDKKDPIRITKRDLEMIQYKRDLLRRANLTSPQMMLQGPDVPIIRKLALETFMQMKAANPEAFRDKTVSDWENALKQYITTRRPAFREELMTKIRDRFGSGKTPPQDISSLIAAEASKELGKTAESPLWGALNRALDEVNK
jgi:hypothetical protein